MDPGSPVTLAAFRPLDRVAHNGTPVVGYARVSSKEQEREGFSIPAQLKLLRGYAASAQMTILKEFVDIETAKQTGRSAFG